MPIRLELGPRDLAAGTALMSRRLSYRQPDAGKEAIPLDCGAGPCWLPSLPRSRRCCCGGPPTSATTTRPRSTPGRVRRRGGGRLGAGAALRRAGLRGRDQGRNHGHAALHPAGRRTRAGHRASAAASRPPTASGSSSPAPTSSSRLALSRSRGNVRSANFHSRLRASRASWLVRRSPSAPAPARRTP